MKRFESVNGLSRKACACLAVALFFAGCTADREMHVLPDGRGGFALCFPVKLELTAKDLQMVADDAAGW